jgi:hypothetical protein
LRWLQVKLNQLTTYVPPPPRDGTDTSSRRILLVHCHPVHDSYSATLATAVEEGAAAGGHEIRRRSLYQDNFQPALTETERKTYFDSTNPSRLASDVTKAVADLKWSVAAAAIQRRMAADACRYPLPDYESRADHMPMRAGVIALCSSTPRGGSTCPQCSRAGLIAHSSPEPRGTCRRQMARARH